jgi:hypothetical protein
VLYSLAAPSVSGTDYVVDQEQSILIKDSGIKFNGIKLSHDNTVVIEQVYYHTGIIVTVKYFIAVCKLR